MSVYALPLLSRTLEMEWEEPQQLFSTEVQVVGYFVQGFSSDHAWNEIWEKGFSQKTSVIYITQETAEGVVRTYFNLDAETMQALSLQYNAERKAFEYLGALDPEPKDIIIKEVKMQNDIITCETLLWMIHHRAFTDNKLSTDLSDSLEFTCFSATSLLCHAFFMSCFGFLPKLIFTATKKEATSPLLAWFPSLYFHHPYASICQMYNGAVSVNTKQANRIAGAAHSNWPCFR